VATAVCWSKIALSSSIIVLLLVAVALPVAPIAHQGDEVMACTTNSERGCAQEAGGGHHAPNRPPCTPCTYAGACPWHCG